MDQYQQFIALSRYARWLPEEGRRETWKETVLRYVDYWKNKGMINENEGNKIFDGIFNLRAMPSMRALMTAGPALDRDQIAGFNCSYLTLDGLGEEVLLGHEKLDEPVSVHLKDPVCFDELMYVLMCGTGVGFSAERQYVCDLPKVGHKLNRRRYLPNNKNYPGVGKSEISIFDKKLNVVKIKDSKYGWASGLRIVLFELFNGNFEIDWDMSEVRPAGAKLKTFGGRASGPQPLKDLFEFAKDMFKKADGRKLTSVEAHDLACKIADIVVVGGVEA